MNPSATSLSTSSKYSGERKERRTVEPCFGTRGNFVENEIYKTYIGGTIVLAVAYRDSKKNTSKTKTVNEIEGMEMCPHNGQ